MKKGGFYGWRIVAAGAGMSALGGGLVGQSFSAYAVLLREEFGWGTALLAGVYACTRLVAGLASPLQGRVIDRLGPRIVMQVGIVITAIGLLLFSQVQSAWQLFVFYSIAALGVTLSGFLTIVTTIVGWFERKRAFALSVHSSGFAFAGLLTPGIVFYLERYGWRSGAIASAIAYVVLMFPLSFVFRHRPADIGEHVDGIHPDDRLELDSTPTVANPTKIHFTAQEAVHTRAFWMISLGHMSALLVVSSVLAHLALYLTQDQGLTLTQAGYVIGALPVLQLIGQFAGGYLGDRYDKRRLAAGAMVSHVVGLLMLAHGTGMWAVAVFIPCHGIAWGIRGPLMQAIRADYFGTLNFGQILGYSSLIIMVGQIIGPYLAGWMNDRTGSYTAGFTIVACMASAGIAFFLLATRPEDPDRRALS